ncbi:MAG: hypothetical protein LBD06_03455 [Candidatus Accumulibacter sp.]|nr:hypothetical protein [Accumulibacter sp.]
MIEFRGLSLEKSEDSARGQSPRGQRTEVRGQRTEDRETERSVFRPHSARSAQADLSSVLCLLSSETVFCPLFSVL